MPAAVVAPGRRSVGKLGVLLLLVLFSAFALIDVAALVAVWPTTAKASAPPPPAAGTTATSSSPRKNPCHEGKELVELWPFSLCLTDEQRLLLVVLLAGMLGGAIHGLQSLAWYVGNRSLVWSWAPWLVLLPLLGGLVSVVFYLVVRGGFFTPTAAGGTANATPNAFGFAAFSALIGLFTNQALLKLQQTFETLLASRETGKDHVASAVRATAIQPNQGPQAGGTTVTITGSGFASVDRVKFGAQAAQQVAVQSDTQLTAKTPPQGPGTVDVELINRDNQNAVLRQSFTYA